MNIVTDIDLTDKFVEKLDDTYLYPVLSRLIDIQSLDSIEKILEIKGIGPTFYTAFSDELKATDNYCKRKLLLFVLKELIANKHTVEEGKILLEVIIKDIHYLNMILSSKQLFDHMFELLNKKEYKAVKKGIMQQLTQKELVKYIEHHNIISYIILVRTLSDTKGIKLEIKTSSLQAKLPYIQHTKDIELVLNVAELLYEEDKLETGIDSSFIKTFINVFERVYNGVIGKRTDLKHLYVNLFLKTQALYGYLGKNIDFLNHCKIHLPDTISYDSNKIILPGLSIKLNHFNEYLLLREHLDFKAMLSRNAYLFNIVDSNLPLLYSLSHFLKSNKDIPKEEYLYYKYSLIEYNRHIGEEFLTIKHRLINDMVLLINQSIL